MSIAPQIPDDFELLDLMMADLSAAPEAFQPTAYWQYYQNRTLQFLRTNGLHNIRRQQDPGITCFGCYEGPLFPTKKQLLDMGLSEAEAEAGQGGVVGWQRHGRTSRRRVGLRSRGHILRDRASEADRASGRRPDRAETREREWHRPSGFAPAAGLFHLANHGALASILDPSWGCSSIG